MHVWLRNILCIWALLTGPVCAVAGARLSPPEQKHSKNLYSQCNAGNGLACHAYGQTLLRLNRPGDRQAGLHYIRRACLLAYTPACRRKSTISGARLPASQSSACASDGKSTLSLAPIANSGGQSGQQITRLSPQSALAKAGLRMGDLIVRLNGEPVTSSNQVYDALKSGQIMLEILRDSTPLPLSIYCR